MCKMITVITIFGRPVPKKNNSRIIRLGNRYSVIPSKVYCEYEKDALEQLSFLPDAPPFRYGKYHVRCLYWLPDKRWFPDLVNLMEATHDILQKAGIIDNDKFIVSVDGSRICGFDKKNPRVEIWISYVDDYELEEVL